ncbi:MAG: glycosyltransferase family 39 protein [Phycisphaerae bacterium]|nr:glycosyltransferase family 39 protein [Phycisphaerae bacterium]
MSKRSRSRTAKSRDGHEADEVQTPHHARRPILVLVAILVVAASLRLAGLGRVAPPGLNQDEAANAWNAYCMLKTGQDQAGARWPIFYSRCLGANRSTLYLYVLLPFQAVGGLNVWTTRVPSAIAGVITVLLIYWVGSRMFGRQVGLLAAALLAVNPWHLQQSRWGHEAALCAFLVMLPFAALLWSGAPFDDTPDDKRRIRVAVAAIAGLLTGICCYGYPAVRIFLPIFLVAAALVTWRGWWRQVRSRKGALAIVALILTVGATFGPLAWQHLTDTEGKGIARRSKTTWVWKPGSTLGEKVWAAVSRYPGHFGPDFLFVRGDPYEVQSVGGFGQFHWYMLPLMLCGVAVVVRRAWASRAARVLLVWLLAYPVSDCLSSHGLGTLHALRSFPGMCSLVLLAALGAVAAGELIVRWRRSAAIGLAIAAAIAAVFLNVRFLHTFFGEYNDRPRVYDFYFHVDLLEACEWLRPRLKDLDAVYCTTLMTNTPYIVTLVGLEYDPRQWFSDERDPLWLGPWLNYSRYGKMHFVYGRDPRTAWQRAVRGLASNGRKDRVVFIARPGELPSKTPPVEQIVGPKDAPGLLIYEGNL